MERVDTVTDVKTKELPTGVTLYLVVGADGTEFSTRERALAQTADEARKQGTSVLLDYDEKKNDRGFTNRYLNSLVPTPEVSFPRNDNPPGLFDDSASTLGLGADQGAGDFPGKLDAKDLQIAKAVALKEGVNILQYLPDGQRTPANVVTAAEFFTRWLLTFKP